MPLRGLTIIVAGRDHDRLRSALGLAATQAALGGRASLFLDGPSVGLLAPAVVSDADIVSSAAGLPTLAELIDTALSLGATIALCQSGLAAADLALDRIDGRIAVGGLTSVIAALGDDRLVMV